jgi:hypothetical protein
MNHTVKSIGLILIMIAFVLGLQLFGGLDESFSRTNIPVPVDSGSLEPLVSVQISDLKAEASPSGATTQCFGSSYVITAQGGGSASRAMVDGTESVVAAAHWARLNALTAAGSNAMTECVTTNRSDLCVPPPPVCVQSNASSSGGPLGEPTYDCGPGGSVTDPFETVFCIATADFSCTVSCIPGPDDFVPGGTTR